MFLNRSYTGRLGLGLLLLGVLFQACSEPPAPSGEAPGSQARREENGSSLSQESPGVGVGEAGLDLKVPLRNVVLITLDTLRWDYVSCYGDDKASTPYIDELAARGVRFEQAVAQVPLTLPSHASILTGTYPQVHGVRDIGGFVLGSEIPTMATIMKGAGYDTAAFVGAAVLHRRFQLSHGFDLYSDDMMVASGTNRLPGVVAEIRADVVSDRVISWLEARAAVKAKKPFFVWAHYYDPHRSYDPPEPYKSRYAQDPYAGETAYTDEQVGRIFDFLEERGLMEDTLIVLLSDHGESLGEHDEFTHGIFIYESTMRIPMVVAGPGIPGGVTVEEQVRSIDVMPTVADYLGLSAGELVQGVSLIPAIEGSEKAASVYAYLETLYPMTHMGWSELRGIRTDDWKLIVAPEPELYDLRKDPGELKNVIKDFPAEAERLEKEVWRVAGPREDLGKLEYKTLDEESMAKLNALGYVSAGIRRDLQLDMSGPDPKHRVKVLDVFERAGEAMNAERFGEAAVKFEAALQDDPTNPILYQHLGLCQTRLGQYRQALTTYEKAIVHAAETDETFADMGEIYLRLGDLSRAVVAMEKSADRNPANLQNLTNLATAYIQLAEIGEAERVLRAILTQEERHAVAYNLLGILEIQKGNDQAAKRYFEKAVELDEYLAQPHMNLGILAQESGQPGQALAYFRAFVERATSAEDRQVVQQVKAVIAELERTQ